MKHLKTILGLGVIVAILPFLGFPSAWKNIMFAGIGLLIMFFAYRVLLEHAPEKTRSEDRPFEDSAFSAQPLHE